MITITDLHKYYGKGENRLEVLKGINLDLEQGDLVCLLGPSGSGKSTLLNIIGGIEVIDDGEVTFQGKSLRTMSKKERSLYRREHVGFVFQFYNLISTLNVRENVEVGAYLSKDPLDVDTILASLGLQEQRNKYPNQISGGQAQRTAIARAMVKKPSLLICDEPTGALDYESAKEVLQLIEMLNKEFHATILIATHNAQIAKMCQRVIHLHNGTIKTMEYQENPLSAREVVW